MKKTNSNHAASTLRGELRAATAKAQSLDKAAQAAKEKVHSAKRRFKESRKALKEAKRAARKAAKLARRAQENLKTCMDKVGGKTRQTVLFARRSASKKPKVKAAAPRKNSPKRIVRPAQRKQLTRSINTVATTDPMLATPPASAPVPSPETETAPPVEPVSQKNEADT